MTCTARERDRAMKLHRELILMDDVVAADVLEPGMGPRDRWTVELVTVGRAIPTDVIQAIADADGEIHPDAPGDEHCKLTVSF